MLLDGKKKMLRENYLGYVNILTLMVDHVICVLDGCETFLRYLMQIKFFAKEVVFPRMTKTTIVSHPSR